LLPSSNCISSDIIKKYGNKRDESASLCSWRLCSATLRNGRRRVASIHGAPSKRTTGLIKELIQKAAVSLALK
jgi:hypothetical protein